MRLYKAEWVRDESGEPDMSGVTWHPRRPEPLLWADYARDRWPEYCECGPDEDGVTWGCSAETGCYKPFFWPSTDGVFRSRSAAQSRVDIINRWGGKAVLVECTPRWETVEDANVRRKAERVQVRIGRKAREVVGLLREYEQLTGELPDVAEAVA